MVNVIDYVPGTTLLHRLNPVTKIALAVALIASSLTADSPIVLVSLLALTLAASAYALVGRQRVQPDTRPAPPLRTLSVNPDARRCLMDSGHSRRTTDSASPRLSLRTPRASEVLLAER